MIVTPVVSRRDVQRFVALPYHLYRDVPQWVPPLRRDTARLLDRRHPYYAHSDGAFFLAERQGRVVGRIGVHENTVFNRVRDRRWAYFHLFEAVDEESTTALVSVARSWAADRGLDRIVGPVGFLPGDLGILVEGFEHRSPMTVTWHPPTYGQMLEAAGFVKETDFLSGRLERPFEPPEALVQASEAAIAENGFSIKAFRSRRELRGWVHHIGEIYNQAFVANWEYWPIDGNEMQEIADRFLPIADPRLIVLVMHGEEIVGYFLILPDAGDGLRRARGRLLPLGWLHILRSARRTSLVDFDGLGVVPAFHGSGVNLAIYGVVASMVGDFPRYRAAELIQVEEGNERMRRNLAALGVTWNKRHRIYGRPL